MQDIIKAKSELGHPENLENAPDFQIETGEIGPESKPKLEEISEAQATVSAPVLPVREVREVRPEADPVMKQIEEFLSDDLLELYSQMPPEAQAIFKTKGEETAGKITEMIRSAKVAAKEILELIVAWLKIIPGVNKFFLEQEAKIKTDKILAFAEEQKAKKVL